MTLAASLRLVLACISSALFAFFFSDTAAAHDPFEITTVGKVSDESLDLVVTMTKPTALELVTGERNSKKDFDKEPSARIELAAAELYEVTSRGHRLLLTSVHIAVAEENEIEFHLAFPPPAPGPLRLEATHLKRLEPGYGSAITLAKKESKDVLGVKYLNSNDQVLDVVLPAGAPAGHDDSVSESPPASPTVRSFLHLGVEHILAGYDHLLFLAGLLLGCRKLRSMLVLVTCFTAAHSLTLALSALDWIVLPERLVESLIAASIVFVGVQNFMSPAEPERRYLITFGFGLIHGMGFAAVLRDLGLGGNGASIALPLLSFNLGVELGQVLIVAVALPLLIRLQKLSSGSVGIRYASLFIAALGAYWLIRRSIGM